MIVKSPAADRYIEKLPPNLAAVLVFGPDQGLVRERVERIGRSVVPDLNDPFRIADLDESTLYSDNARLFDEAAAISMLGGRRVVRVRNAGNGLAKLFESFLDDPRGDALIVVEAGDLAKSSSLRKIFEDADNAAAIACYPDETRELVDVVRRAFAAEGMSIDAEALDDVVSRLGSDRGITRQELEKLALYASGKKRIELDDVRAVIGDESEAGTEEVCDAAGQGDERRLDMAPARLWVDGVSPAQIIRNAISHFQRLLQVRVARDRGESVEAAMKRGWPQIHFSRTASFKAQVQRWSEERLLSVCDLLIETEALTRTTAVPAQTITGRAFFTIADWAKVR